VHVRGAVDQFHLVSLAWNPAQVTGILESLATLTGLRMSHICVTPSGYEADAPHRLFFLRQDARGVDAKADRELLASLEVPGDCTIHNIVLSDRIVRQLPYEDALAYLTVLARRFRALYEELVPSAVVGWFDGAHAAVGMAVARAMGIPWFAMHFTALPPGLSAFCQGLSPDRDRVLPNIDRQWLRSVAERTLREFEANALSVPSYVAAIKLGTVIARMPRHLRELATFVGRAVIGSHDRYLDPPLSTLLVSYARKRFNTVTVPSHWLLRSPPDRPYILFALQMQPESSIDVWAPFSSDQLGVVDALVRSTPPTHDLLVKLHQADADRYSRGMLEQFRRLPGVRLVSPHASSRPFVERAAVVATVEGTIALEGALLGKPVVMFGAHGFGRLPSVSRVGALTALPALIRAKIAEPAPTREEILEGFISYLSGYGPSYYNADGATMPTGPELAALGRQFLGLRDSVALGGI
jgi:hypothetical protein